MRNANLPPPFFSLLAGAGARRAESECVLACLRACVRAHTTTVTLRRAKEERVGIITSSLFASFVVGGEGGRGGMTYVVIPIRAGW